MTPRRLEFLTNVHLPLEDCWDFFRRPQNLEKLTPPEVKFDIVSPDADGEMYEGMIIQYRVSPFSGFTSDWVTEITKIERGSYFVDIQLVGPFALWHHQHHFRAVGERMTEMKDILHYSAPLGPLGTLADRLFVHKQVRKIFDSREEAIVRMFPPPS